MSNRITDRDAARIKILAMTGRYTPQEIATYFESKYTPEQVMSHLANKDPEAKKKVKREKSRGAVKLKDILSKIFPDVIIQEEYHLGERLRLDFHIAAPYNLGFEFDGVQHSKFTNFLHRSSEDFDAGQARDSRKEDLCKGRGISLVRITYQDDMTEDFVRSKIEQAGYGSGEVQPGFETVREKLKQKRKEASKKAAEYRKEKYSQYKTSEVHQQKKQKQNDIRKQQYQKQKEWRKANNHKKK